MPLFLRPFHGLLRVARGERDADAGVGPVGGVAGAVGHNAGQLLMSMLLVDSSLIYYAPWLLLMALAAGTLTGTALNLLMPALERLPVRLNPGLKKI